jgi:hypothetical protein
MIRAELLYQDQKLFHFLKDQQLAVELLVE